MNDVLLSDARRALSRGDVLIAYDLAHNVLADDPDDVAARFLVALSLARSGASEQAGIETAELRRRLATDEAASPRLREDADALVARLAKDEALANQYNRSYSCVNAASLWHDHGRGGHPADVRVVRHLLAFAGASIGARGSIQSETALAISGCGNRYSHSTSVRRHA